MMKFIRHFGLCLVLTLSSAQPLFAAFPQVQTTNTGSTASGTNHTITLPSGVTTGDLIVIIVSETLGSTITVPGDYTTLWNTAQGGTMTSVGAYKVAGASESNPTFTTGASTSVAFVAYRIDSWSGTAPEAGTSVGAVTSTPNPPSVTPSWGAADTLWIAVAANDSTGTVSAIPTNYGNQVSQTAAVGIISTARRELNAASEDPGTFTHSVSDDTVAQTIAIPPVFATLEQEGFRWGVDDGSESAHGWEANQDTNITIAANQSRLLRVLVNATLDPGALAYTLRYQKNGSGGYAVVPVGASTTTSPPAAPTATVTTVGTASTTWNLNRPTASSGDLVVFVVAWDDSTDTTSVTAPAGPNSESAVSIAGPIASASTEMRAQAWYYVATGAWSGGTSAWTPSASETCRAVAFVIPSGQYKSSDPIGWANTRASAGTAESNVNSPTGTTEGDDGNGRMYIAFGSDVDALTAPGSNWNTINNATGGGVGLLVGSRDTLASNSESVTALTATIASDSWASLAFVVKPHIVTNEVYITTSANIAAGGEATTARLTAPSGKTTGDFVTGRRWDDENGTDTIDITTDDYTEVEWLVFLANTLVANDYEEFRVYAGNNALDTYTVTPRWTIPGGGAAAPPLRALIGVGH